MKKLTSILLAGAGLALGAQSANAITYVDIDSLLKTVNPNSPVSGFVDLDPVDSGDSFALGMYDSVDYGTISDVPGFQTSVSVAESARVMLFISDAAGDTESFTLDLDFPSNFTTGSFPGGDITTLGLTFDFGLGAILATVNTAGQLFYTLTASSGEFQVDYVVLEATVRQTAVPDGGLTALLLGIGLLGLTGFAGRLPA